MNETNKAVSDAHGECAAKIRQACVEFHRATGLTIAGASLDYNWMVATPRPANVNVRLHLSDLRSR